MNIKSRKTEAQPIQDAIKSFLETFKLKDKFDETYLSAFWERLMGKTIASRTARVYVKKEVLFIEVTSAPLRDELSRVKTLLIKKVNDEVGRDMIKDVVFL
mgnify:FL=1